VQYVDSSALVKLYVAEHDSATGERLLLADPVWSTAAHTGDEVRRTLSLEALHLAAAARVGAPVVRLVTDVRLGQVARSLGWTVVGA
jgi:hypothetical protein